MIHDHRPYDEGASDNIRVHAETSTELEEYLKKGARG